MTNTFFRRNWVRWILSVASAGMTLVVMFYISVFAIFMGSAWSSAFMPLFIGVLTSFPVVLVGSLVAPRYQIKVALFLWTLCTAVAISTLGGFQAASGYYWLGPVVGGGVATGMVAWWISPGRTPRSTRRFFIGVCVAFIAVIGNTCARFSDFPARPDTLTPQLARVLGPSEKDVKALYQYDLGGFIDREGLWRIDGDEAAIARVISELSMEPTSTVPEEFWAMPPYYWLSNMPTGGEAFQSPDFPPYGRGRDGVHYFLVHDKAEERAYVWMKDNF